MVCYAKSPNPLKMLKCHNNYSCSMCFSLLEMFEKTVLCGLVKFFSALVRDALRICRLWERKCHFINFAILIYKINNYVGKLKEKIEDLISAFLEREV